MSINQGSINVNQRVLPSGFPFTVGSARNGLSVDATGRIVLGQDIGQVGSPADLISNREIPMQGFTIDFLGTTLNLLIDDSAGIFRLTEPLQVDKFFEVNIPANTWLIGDRGTITNLLIADAAVTANDLFYNDTNAFDALKLGNLGFGTPSEIRCADNTSSLTLNQAPSGSQAQLRGVSVEVVVSAAGFIISGDTTLVHTLTTLSNNAGANVGTLNNSPTAGNPSKWIAIDDNGTIRKIPTWL